MDKNRSIVKCNNFNMLRFMAAIMVITGHMAYIDGSNKIPILFGQGIQVIGVKILFLLGGYLISKSWFSDSNMFRYALKRIMRIMPALLVYVIFASVFVGPLVSDLSLIEYYKNSGFLWYLKNIFLFPIYSLPAVFTNNPYSGVVNGSLWTLPVEVAMYILVPIMWTIIGIDEKGKCRRKSILLGGIIIVCVLQILHLYKFHDWRLVVYGTNWVDALDLIPYYLIGMFYSSSDFYKKCNLELATVLLVIYSCISINLSAAFNELLAYIIIPFFVFSFGLKEKPLFSNCFKKYEISYGMYLYGFLIQQILVWFCMKNKLNLNSVLYLIISILLTCLVAAISYRFVELPSQKLCKRILSKSC